MILKIQDRGSLVADIQRKLGITADGVFGKGTDAALKHFQAENGLRADGVAGRQTFNALGLPHFAYYVPNISRPKYPIDKNIAWELPVSGDGFRTYNRESYGDQFARKATIEKIINIAKDWHCRHPERNIQIGDISRLYGGAFINPLTGKKEHATHSDGRSFDMRPIGNAYAPMTYKDARYSRDLTREFLQMMKGKSTVYFNDPVLMKEGLCSYSRLHDNHLHLIV